MANCWNWVGGAHLAISEEAGRAGAMIGASTASFQNNQPHRMTIFCLWCIRDDFSGFVGMRPFRRQHLCIGNGREDAGLRNRGVL
jgi:hypothetical protein